MFLVDNKMEETKNKTAEDKYERKRYYLKNNQKKRIITFFGYDQLKSIAQKDLFRVIIKESRNLVSVIAIKSEVLLTFGLKERKFKLK